MRLHLVVLAAVGCGGSQVTSTPDASVPPVDAAPPPDVEMVRPDAAVLCRASTERCTDDGQCCNRLCDRPGGATEGACAQIGLCRTAGEPCAPAGFNTGCCSVACAPGADGIPRCQRLGGCLQEGELCGADAECCSGACRQDGTTRDGRPVMRCAAAACGMPAGGLCGIVAWDVSCCPNGGGDFGCTQSSIGLGRCVGGVLGCGSLPSEVCTSTDACCKDTYPTITCQATARGQICCLADGEACAFGDVCCGGTCAPAGDGFRCRSTCVPDGEACMTDSDCCGCCVRGACASGAACGDCTGPWLGEACDPAGAECCGSPAVICAGIPYANCILAP